MAVIPDLVAGELDWSEEPVCDGVGLELFFPRPGDYQLAHQVIKAYCKRCPARAECLDFALRHEEPKHRAGIWGGMTPGERDAHSRKG